MVSSKAPGSGETIGSIDETKAKPKNDQEEKSKPPETVSQEEQIPEGVEEEVEVGVGVGVGDLVHCLFSDGKVHSSEKRLF